MGSAEGSGLNEFIRLSGKRSTAQAHQQRAPLVFNLEAVGESQIDIGQRRAMLLAHHQLAGKEMTDTSIRDERLVKYVLRRSIELAADIVALEPARGRCNQACAGAGVDVIVDR